MAGTGSTRRVPSVYDLEVLEQDLLRYCEAALAEGAAAAVVIPADWVSVDERVRLKCIIPRCPMSGLCGECPSGDASDDLDLTRKALARFKRAVLIRVDVPNPELVSDFQWYKENQPTWGKSYAKVAKIVAKVETMAFGDAYHLAIGYAAGCCKVYLCGADPTCRLSEDGRCRHPLKARPSMESSGIDVFAVAAKAGWDIYPIYKTVDPQKVPSAAMVGIVFVN